MNKLDYSTENKSDTVDWNKFDKYDEEKWEKSEMKGKIKKLEKNQKYLTVQKMLNHFLLLILLIKVFWL